MSFAPQSIWMALETLFAPTTLLTLALRGVLLLLLAAIIVRVTFKASAASRHLIWAMAMVALLLLPALSATLPALQVNGPSWLTDRWATYMQDAAPTTTADETVALAADQDIANRLEQRQNVLGRNQAGDVALPAPQPRNNRQAQRITQPPARILDSRNDTSAGFQVAEAVDAGAESRSSAASWLLPLWLIGLVGVAGWFALQHLSVRWLTLHAVEVEEGELVDLMHRLRRHIDLRRPVRLLMGHRTMMPMTWGIFRPVMLLPDNVADWPANRREDVLLHELAHIKRRDHLSQVLAQIACAVHWFNPLTWYAVRRMTLEREHACDDYVLNSGTRPSDYATNLLEVARSMKRGPVTSMAAIAMAGRSTLKDRLQAVLDDGRTRNTLGGRLATVALLLVAAVAIPLASLEIVTVEELQAAGPKVGEKGRAPRSGYSYSFGSDSDNFVISADDMVIFHDGERIELPYVNAGEALAILGTTLEGINVNILENLDEEIGFALRELQSDDTSPFRYYAFDDEQMSALQERLEEVGDSVADLGVLVRPNGGGFQFDFDSGAVAPRSPRGPRPPRSVRAPRVSILPFQVAGGTWDLRTKGKSNWKWNDGDDRMSLRTRGEIEFNEAGTDVESISPKGYFDFEMEDDKTDYRVRFRADQDGAIERTWWVDGDKQPFDDDARKWMAQAMPELFRRTGFNAGPRVQELLDSRGVDAVLEEIDTLESDHVTRIYFGELLERANLDSKQYGQVFDKAGESIHSDFELATLLAQAADSGNLKEDAVVQYAKAAGKIDSDFETRRALTVLLKTQNLTPKSVEAVLEASISIHSDFELASLLVDLAKEYPVAYQSPLFLEALSSVGSDFEQRRVLTGVAKQRDLSQENLTKALEIAAENIHSDFELAEFLLTTARFHKIQGTAVAPYLQGLSSLGSDFEYRRAATAAIRRGEMDIVGVTQLVKMAGEDVNSDFELSELLQLVADNYDVDGELREAYMDASDSINSRHESNRALSAIDAEVR